MTGQLTIWSTSPFRMTQNNQYRPSPQEIDSKNGLVQLREDCRITKTSGRSRERLAETHGSATPRPPESVRPAATPLEGPSVAANGDVMLPPAEAHPCCRPSSLSHSLERGPCQLSSSRSWSMDFAPVGSIIAACTFSIPPHAASGRGRPP